MVATGEHFMSQPGGTSAAALGDRVLARWPAETEWWYPGIVCIAEPSRLTVQFDDGDRAELAPWEVLPLSLSVGSRVYGRWQGGAYYYPGQITRQRGEAIHISYDDGDEEWTAVSMVRVHRDDLGL
jgi:hypothetical protein